MDFTKFVWMLHRSALYFAQADKSGDPYEGHYTRPMVASMDAYVDHVLGIIQAQGGTITEKGRENMAIHLRRRNQLQAQFFLNCWHMNEDEALAMWKLYTSHGDAVCVRSTYKDLAQHLPEQCFLGCVTYLDYRTQHFDLTNMLSQIVHKRESFEHERELRAVLWDHGNPPLTFEHANGEAGRIVPINLAKIIKDVLVSPNANPPLHEVVEAVTRKYGLEVPVRQSDANAGPPY
jgi:hypothetical protein